jgi:hypothetical protein
MKKEEKDNGKEVDFNDVSKIEYGRKARRINSNKRRFCDGNCLKCKVPC